MGIPRWLRILEDVGPLVIAAAFPPLIPVTSLVIAAAKAAEAIPGATGEQKNQIAQQIAAIGAQFTNVTTGKPLVDPALAADITGDVFTAVVQATNAAQAGKPAK